MRVFYSDCAALLCAQVTATQSIIFGALRGADAAQTVPVTPPPPPPPAPAPAPAPAAPPYTIDDSVVMVGFYYAVGEAVILLQPPLPPVGVSIGMERGVQQTYSLADG